MEIISSARKGFIRGAFLANHLASVLTNKQTTTKADILVKTKVDTDATETSNTGYNTQTNKVEET